MIHRARTEALFDFHYRLEIYVPKDEREYGCFVLPILFGDRLVGRLDPTFDRATNVLRVRRVWAERGAPAEAGEAVAAELTSLARWLGVGSIHVGAVPAMWRGTRSERSELRGCDRLPIPGDALRYIAMRRPRGGDNHDARDI